MIKTLGLTHLALLVRDLERSIKFYQEALGAQVLFRQGRAADINTPGAKDIITLVESDAETVGQSAGLEHFGFRLLSPDDIESAVTALEQAGAEIVGKGEFEPGEPYVFAKDPDGYVIEIWYEKEGD